MPVSAIPSLDVTRYLGRWYEICRLPLKFEDAEATDISATYSLKDDGSIRVDNRCFDAKGKPTQAVGEAKATDDTMAKLKVNFLPAGLRWLPFTDGDYWVLKIDDAYAVSLVGTPDRKHLWLLARSWDVSEEMLRAYLGEAHEQGFDLGHLITPKHTGREVTDEMLSG